MKKLLIGLTAALLLTTAGVAVASIPDGSGVIHGCYKTSDDKLRVIDSASQSCAGGETAITWSHTGPQGPTGADGATGATGADGADGATGPQAPGLTGFTVTTVTPTFSGGTGQAFNCPAPNGDDPWPLLFSYSATVEWADGSGAANNQAWVTGTILQTLEPPLSYPFGVNVYAADKDYAYPTPTGPLEDFKLRVVMVCVDAPV